MNFTRAESLTTGISADGRIISQSKDIRSEEDARRQRMRESRPEFRRESGGMAEGVGSSMEATAIEEAAARAAFESDQLADPMVPTFNEDDFDIMAKERKAAKRVRMEDEEDYTTALAARKRREGSIGGKTKQEALEMAVLGMASSSSSKMNHRTGLVSGLIAVKAKPKSTTAAKAASGRHHPHLNGVTLNNTSQSNSGSTKASNDDRLASGLAGLISAYQSSSESSDNDDDDEEAD